MAQLESQVCKRLLKVTSGNLRQSHLYVTGHYDFFPSDCFGASRKGNGECRPIQIELDGFAEPVSTDIGCDKSTGKPRKFFRERMPFRKFFEHHRIQAGDELALVRLGKRRYRLTVETPSAKGPVAGLKAAEFFAGIGLVRLALEKQGWQVVFANDCDPDKAEMYREAWPRNNHLAVEDVHNLEAASLPTCDLFTASFPCNDLSIAGKWAGLSGKESSAFWGLISILRDMKTRRPPFVLLENVVGFLMSKGGDDLRNALLALNELGYATDAIILNAKHWVPQSRARLFVVGRTPRADRQAFPLVSDVRPQSLTRFIAANQDIRWDLYELPRLPNSGMLLADIVEPLPDTDSHWWDVSRAEYFFNQMSVRHQAEAKRMIEGRTFSYATAFRRIRNSRSMAELRTDGIAGCLRTPRGGSGRQILFKAGKGRYQVRLLTARECARLQGVPDTFPINVPLNQALFGFGDAVCVPAVEWVLKHCLRCPSS